MLATMTGAHRHEGSRRCVTCGQEADPRDRHSRFTLPDPVLALPEREHTPGSWLSHSTAAESVMMQVPDCGPFIRVLLPVRLDDDTTITYGTWLAVHPDSLQAAFAVWWSPDYAHLRLEGRLANNVPPGGTLFAPATAVVLHPDHTPYVQHSDHPVVSRLLHETWSGATFT
jgi:hypothetical protein